MRKDDEAVPAPATNQNQRSIATEAALPVGELAEGGSENGYAALVAQYRAGAKSFVMGAKWTTRRSLCQWGGCQV